MIYRIKIRDLSADVTKHTTTKHKIIVYGVIIAMIAVVLICAFLK